MEEFASSSNNFLTSKTISDIYAALPTFLNAQSLFNFPFLLSIVVSDRISDLEAQSNTQTLLLPGSKK
jgi:hypothetical protein